MDTVFFRLPMPTCLRDLNADTALHWQQVDSEYQILASGVTDLSAAYQLTTQHRCVFLVPVAEVYLTQLTLKTTNKKQLYQAVPYALEEELSEDIEQLHFALNTHSQSGVTSVMVMNRARLQELNDLLNQYQLTPEIITADIYNLSWQDASSWSCLIEHEHALVRTALADGFCCACSELSQYIDLSIKHTEHTPEQLRIYAAADTPGLTTDIAGIALELHNTPSVCQQFESTHINLLQQEFAVQKTQLTSVKPWMTAFALTVALVMLLLLGNVIEVARLNALDKQLNQAVEATFRQAFPEVVNIVNPRVQMEQRMADIAAQNQQKQRSLFLKLLHHSADSMRTHADSAIVDIHYKASQLSLDIIVPTIQVLEALTTTMQSKQMNVEVQTARNEAQHVEARIIVEEQ